jgi:hypothetical protein
MSAQPQPQVQAFTAYNARTYNKNHQQVQHIINRMLQLLEVPNKAARTINGIHGMLNGIDKSKFPVFRSHQFVALQMDFRGKADSSDVFMSRALAAVDAAELKCGHSFFKITRADGIHQKMTSYDVDYLSDAAEWALVQVKNSPDYFKNPAKAVTDEILWEAINKFLPERKPPDPKASGDGGPSITDDSIIKAQWSRILNNAEENLIRELESGADPVLAARTVAGKIVDMGKKIKDRFERERLRALTSMGDEDEVESEVSGNNTSDVFSPTTPFAAPDDSQPPKPQTDSPPPQTDEVDDYGWSSIEDKPSSPPPQTVRVNCEKPNENESFSPDTPPSMLEWALFWADNGIPVFPLYSVTPEGICRCRDGAQCKSPGKHPKTFRGLKEATTDKSQIERWWRADPQANIGGATGGKARLLVVDCDPRHGGDASLHDLVEAHGPEWLDTLTHKTGAGGHHFCYTYPADVDLRNTANKLAPGIDTRAEGGYVVLPPSLHASLKRYELANLLQTRQAPAWLIEELTRDPKVAPSRVIDFQERRARQAPGAGVIPDGERNETLFKTGCAIWGQGEAQDSADLHMQLLEINGRRCSPPLADAEVARITGSIAGRYPRGVPQ